MFLYISLKNFEHQCRALLHLLQLLIYIAVVHQLMVLTLLLLRRHCLLLSICLQLSHEYRCDVSRLILLFLQLILCWKSYCEPHAHVVGKLLNGQPYRILIPSQNCCLFKSKRYSFNGNAFNQFETSFSRAISFNRFCFMFKFSKISFNLFL